MPIKTSKIFVTFQREGIHYYPAAATDPNLATGDKYDVSFLANKHRHLFHFKVAIEVFHQDRDVEFVQFKRWLEHLYGDGILQLDYRSCEMIANELNDHITKKYSGRNTTIEVSEDNENGCIMEFDNH